MSAHLDEIRVQYPGQLVLTADQTATALGRKRQTVYNQVNKDVFPVRVIKQTGKKGGWGCSIVDLAHYLDTGVNNCGNWEVH
jgi:predicted DNA-binding transcriptional regulator AlpA